MERKKINQKKFTKNKSQKKKKTRYLRKQNKLLSKMKRN